MLDILKQVGLTPRACVWELTLACNLRCKHCGSFAGSRRDDEMSLEENLRVADQLAALGCRRVTLSGGEPTLNRIGIALANASPIIASRSISSRMAGTGTHRTSSARRRLACVARPSASMAFSVSTTTFASRARSSAWWPPLMPALPADCRLRSIPP